MTHIIEQFEHKGFVAKIVHDECPDNPMDHEHGDPVGTITYASNRYLLGTRRITDTQEHTDIKRDITAGKLIGMPVFAYIHSGTALKAAHTNPFHCKWDSGQSGLVYCTREKACAEWGTAADKLAQALGGEWRLSEEATAKALAYMSGEVETFGQYLNGECYSLVIEDPRGNVVESICGYYGMDHITEEAKRMAREVAQAHEKQARREKRERNTWASRGMVTA